VFCKKTLKRIFHACVPLKGSNNCIAIGACQFGLTSLTEEITVILTGKFAHLRIGVLLTD
jgi:hypothetical protein